MNFITIHRNYVTYKYLKRSIAKSEESDSLLVYRNYEV